MDSNHDKGLQRALCYHYTIGHAGLKVVSRSNWRKANFRVGGCDKVTAGGARSSSEVGRKNRNAQSWSSALRLILAALASRMRVAAMFHESPFGADEGSPLHPPRPIVNGQLPSGVPSVKKFFAASVDFCAALFIVRSV